MNDPHRVLLVDRPLRRLPSPWRWGWGLLGRPDDRGDVHVTPLGIVCAFLAAEAAFAVLLAVLLALGPLGALVAPLGAAYAAYRCREVGS